MAETLGEWERTKPVEGSQRPAEAIAALAAFDAKLTKLRGDRENMRKARNALDMAEGTLAGIHDCTVIIAGPPSENDQLAVASEELADLKAVWTALTPVYSALDEMKEKTWLSVQPRKLRQNLDELLNQLKQLPVKYKSYKSYEHAKQMMHNYSKVDLSVVQLSIPL